MTLRTRACVDGLNLYYGALKDTRYRWLNLAELVRQMLPSDYALDKLLYFSARISGILDPKAPGRQQIYLNALATLPEAEIHTGHFLSKTIWRPLVNLPIANLRIGTPEPVTLPPGNHPVGPAQTLPVGSYPAPDMQKRRRTSKAMRDAVVAEVRSLEEKGSDVNLAAHLLNDAWKGLFDAAVMVSNDTDLVTPIRMVTLEQSKPIIIVCPGRWKIAPKLAAVASHVRHIRPSMLRTAQFPDQIPGTAIRRPASW